ncbi:hypothetical protein BGZ59_002782 [Podila verticillata]|nr:hypothetical protein BGZ59_002782 [Podila verticillata]
MIVQSMNMLVEENRSMYAVPRPFEKAGKTKSQIKNAKRRMNHKKKKMHTGADDNDIRVSSKANKPGVIKQEQSGADCSKTATTSDKDGSGEQFGTQRHLKRKATQLHVASADDDVDDDNDDDGDDDVRSKTDDHGITQNKSVIKDDYGVENKPIKKRFAAESEPSVKDEPSTDDDNVETEPFTVNEFSTEDENVEIKDASKDASSAEDENIKMEPAFKDAPSTEDESGTDNEATAEKEPALEPDAWTRKVEGDLMTAIFSDTSSDTSTSDHSELLKTAGNCKTGSVSSFSSGQARNLRKLEQALLIALKQAARTVDRLDETRKQVVRAQDELENTLDDLAFARGELKDTKSLLERAQIQFELAQSQLTETVIQLNGANEELALSQDTMRKMEGRLKELSDQLVLAQMHV